MTDEHGRPTTPREYLEQHQALVDEQGRAPWAEAHQVLGEALDQLFALMGTSHPLCPELRARMHRAIAELLEAKAEAARHFEHDRREHDRLDLLEGRP